MNKVMWSCAVSAAVVVSLAGVDDARAAIPPYLLVGEYAAPAGHWDIGPDGLLVAVTAGGDVLRQSAASGSAYSVVGHVNPALLDASGPSFVSLSPSGQFVAIGDGRFNAGASVHFFSSAAFDSASTQSPLSSVVSPNFDAVWHTDGRVYVTGADPSDFTSLMTRLDVAPGAASATATTVITHIGDGSGGVAVDTASNRLITGVGFSFGTDAGVIRAFDLAAAGSITSPIEFSTGTMVAQVLTAYPLGVDRFGNVLVGGGDVFGSPLGPRFAAVVDPAAPGSPLMLAPSGPLSLYSARFNFALDELLVTDGTTIFRYAVPGPGAGSIVVLAGVFASRRRRCA